MSSCKCVCVCVCHWWKNVKYIFSLSRSLSLYSNRVYGTVGKTIVEIVKVLIENAGKLYDIFAEFYRKLQQAFEERILPALKQTYTQLEAIGPRIYEDTLTMLANLFERVAKSLKAFEEDFAKIGKAISETFKSFAAMFTKYFEIIRKELYDVYAIVADNVREMHAFDYVKERFAEVSVVPASARHRNY